ncbi:MAG: hypothetical protein EAZ65_07840 [Verrucomicrobia bacterium]|nr:MAG: hypothetical protein EAZ84_07105 [Verrucomicrobiota bacterium]TAE87065.1 MAG: hypothetical protein EAZ82_09190 [Verrucomicrobiota bacterium]TAF24827.1 MAG: hypothetical protein EAZ71_09275 [Verrucomicrobiota bacterium]TAF40614.1 MAG: hypothetical protein EAZ65_07840 [Verrucomicrobiota bacterium]
MKTIFAILAVFLSAVSGLTAQNAITINSGGAIEIQIKGVPAEEMALISGTYTVSDGGTISMPLLSSAIRAAGMSPTSLARNIEAAYRAEKIYTTPSINVIANSGQDLAELIVTVGGQVRRPGPVKYSRGLTLYNAVQAAGGATEFGSMRRVGLLRGNQLKEYDLRQVKFMNILVEPQDTITVPQKGIINQ